MRFPLLSLCQLGLLLGAAGYGTACIEAVDYTALPPSVPALRLPANDGYEGSVITGSLLPRFSWLASTTSEKGKRITYELQYSVDASFEAEVSTNRTEETQFQPESALPVSFTAPVGRRYYWRVRACVASNCSDYSRPRWVNLGRSDKDLNGDGYADVVVGARLNSEVGLQAGKAYVYFGGPGSSLDPVADGSMVGTQQLDSFGADVGIAPDLNGDGFSDLLVSSPFDDALNDGSGTRSGSVSVFYGGAGSTFHSTPDGLLSSAVANEEFGGSISPIGDLNGDGYSDVAIGAPYSDALGGDAGRVYVYWGRSGGVSSTPTGILDGKSVGVRFGSFVSTAGDLDGDGVADLLVDERGSGVDGARTCQSFVYLGAQGSAFDAMVDRRYFVSSLTDCGMAAEHAGDVDGDGTSELVISLARTYPSGDYVYVYPSPIAGTIELDVTAAPAAFESSILSASVPIGDVNGDGHDDLAVNGSANVSVHLGRADGTFEQTPAGILRGSSFIVKCAAGDVNGDGFDDVLIGAPEESSGGRVYLYLGGPGSTFDANADAVLNSTVTGEHFGYAIT
jgi:FG-GAP-like repeat/FG-GAP repeat